MSAPSPRRGSKVDATSEDHDVYITDWRNGDAEIL
jgi:hypothetical protein